MDTNTSSERAQALIIIAVAFIALLGFVALAIDGGMTYADRRLAQAGSDAASLSGAGVAALHIENAHIYGTDFKCDHSDVLAAQKLAAEAAINHASVNGYTIDVDHSDGNGVEVVCDVFFNGSYEERYIDVTTHISETVHTGFMQLVFDEEMINHVQSTVRLSPRIENAHGYAIVALNPDDCLGHQHGVMLSGSIDVNVTGGGIFSNGCLRGNGVSLTVDANGNPILAVEDLECDPDGCPGFSPSPGLATGGTLPEGSYDQPVPDCESLGPNLGAVKKGGTISPGNYTEIDLHASGDSLTMEAGLYCLTGSPKAMVISGGTLRGTDVTIYVESGEVAISGNADVVLTAPRDPDAYPEIYDVLIYLAEGNTGAVELEGNAESVFDGIVYAPDGFIEAKGSTELDVPVEFSLQLVGWDVEIGGGADININYDGSKCGNSLTEIDMWK